ncbi:hypothetical protein TNCV_1499011 [Trichonephila clavipes]|nr:hypothetical protein TNCV_1499011 [Trichonephila clavipes]
MHQLLYSVGLREFFSTALAEEKNVIVVGLGKKDGKKISGLKRLIAVDTQSLPHAIHITTAEATDLSSYDSIIPAMSSRSHHNCSTSTSRSGHGSLETKVRDSWPACHDSNSVSQKTHRVVRANKALDKNIQAQTVVCPKKEVEKDFTLRGKGMELKLGDKILENKTELSDSSSDSSTRLSGAENSEYAVAETFKDKTNFSKYQPDLMSGDKFVSTSSYDTRSMQSNIGSKLADKHKWWESKNRDHEVTNKHEWIVDFPAPRPERYEPPVKQNRLSCPHRVQYRFVPSRSPKRDSQHSKLRSSEQEAKLESSKFGFPILTSSDKTLHNLEDIDEDYRLFNEQCRSKFQQQATRTRDWRSRVRGLFHDIRDRARQVFSRKRD